MSTSVTVTTPTPPSSASDAAIALLDPARDLTADERARVDEIKQAVDIDSQASVLAFGTGSESAVAAFADTVLNQVMARDLGPVHEHLSEIKLIAQGLDSSSLKNDGGFLGKLFFNLKREIARFSDRFMTARGQIDAIAMKIDDEVQKIRHGLIMLDKLFEQTEINFRELGLHIQAGRELLEHQRAVVLPALEAEAAARAGMPDAMLAAQKVRDLKNALELLDRKVANLEKSRSIAFMQMPTIRQVQLTGVMLVQEMQMAVAHAIPVWKSTMMIHIEQVRQANGLATMNAMTDFTNAQIQAMATALDQNTVEMHKQTARGIADVDAIANAIGTLVGTLDKIDQLEADARKAREEGRVRLAKAEDELRQRHAG